jgi:hypothetical protein
MKWDWDWTAIGTVALAVATVILAGATFRTLHFLKKAQIDQAEELVNQRISLDKQTKAVEAQTKTLQISAEHFATTELLTMNRWLAENPHLHSPMELPEDKPSYQGENAAAVLSGFMDQILRHCRLMDLGTGKLWMPYFEDKLRQYPQVRKRINLYPDWYSDVELKELAKEVSKSVGLRSCPPLKPRPPAPAPPPAPRPPPASDPAPGNGASETHRYGLFGRRFRSSAAIVAVAALASSVIYVASTHDNGGGNHPPPPPPAVKADCRAPLTFLLLC